MDFDWVRALALITWNGIGIALVWLHGYVRYSRVEKMIDVLVEYADKDRESIELHNKTLIEIIETLREQGLIK